MERIGTRIRWNGERPYGTERGSERTEKDLEGTDRDQNQMKRRETRWNGEGSEGTEKDLEGTERDLEAT